jgi:transcriptional regulator with XRE-family HTH domain
MTTNATEERQAWHGQVQLWDLKRIAALRERHGWTQEELAERSGLSVRTIRNLELGRIRNPRRSSIDLLTTALGIVAERNSAGPLERPRWRGPQPPGSAVVGSRAEHERLARTVRANRLTTLVGPGGVGKTRLALHVAAEVGHYFRHGVVVVELGDLAPERHAGGAQTVAVLERVRRELADLDEPDRDLHVLVVLDNAEHVPDGVTAAARELLGAHRDLQVLITARRTVTERLGVNHAILPLPVDGPHAPAVELVLRHAGADTRMAADHAREVRLVTELCRRLGGLPRYLEFAAERMRTLPVKLLLEHGPSMGMLWSGDHALLPHQRSVADSILWDLDMFSSDHRVLLTRIAAWPNRRFTLDAVATAHERGGPSGPHAGANPLAMLSDLLEMSFVVPDPGHRDSYRLAPYVAEAVDDVAVPAPRLA